MNAVIGTLLTAVAIIFYAFCYLLYRRPQRGRWTEWDLPAQFLMLLFVGFLSFGISFLVRFAVLAGREPLTTGHLGLILATLATTVALYLLLRLRWRRYQLAERQVEGPQPSADAILLSIAGNGSSPGSPPRPVPSGGRRGESRRKAA